MESSNYEENAQILKALAHPTRLHILELLRKNQPCVKAMEEVGIDISHHTSKSTADFINQEIDCVITVCDKAKQTCPFFPGGKKVSHHSFEDPSQAQGTDEERLEVFREVRDEIEGWIKKTFGEVEDDLE